MVATTWDGVTMNSNISWEYLPIYKENFGDKHIEIFEYCGKYVVSIGVGKVNSVNVLESRDNEIAWTFFNNIVNSFHTTFGGQ